MTKPKKKTFAVLIEMSCNANTICGQVSQVQPRSLEGFGRVVIENDSKNAWGNDGELFPIKKHKKLDHLT